MVNSILEPAPSVADAAEKQTASGDPNTAAPNEATGDPEPVALQKQAEQPKSIFINEKKKAEEFRNYGKDTPRYETVRAFYEEQHEKQTYEFATAALEEYTSTSRCTMPVWEALMFVSSISVHLRCTFNCFCPATLLRLPCMPRTHDAVLSVGRHIRYLNGVVDDSDPDTDLDQLAHALQTAEAARKAHPGEEFDWLHVTGFIHDLGKIMAVKEKGFKGSQRGVLFLLLFFVSCTSRRSASSAR